MIKSFGDRRTREFWETGSSRRLPASLVGAAKRKLMLLDAAASLEDLRVPPGNRLEALKSDRLGQYSIRINDQFRICFTWRDNNAHEVEITDYH